MLNCFKCPEINFASRLRSLLSERGMRQHELADMLYVSQNALSTYVCGVFEPSIGTLCRMADLFEVTVDYLLGRTNSKGRF